MSATWCALCERGYADLTMQAIADESSVSKPALHYHYDSKQDLLEAFLDHAASRFVDSLEEAADEAEGPEETLTAVLDTAFSPPALEDSGDMSTALLELRTQAAHDEAFSARLRGADEAFRELLVDVLTDGVERGVFRADLDPEEVAHVAVTFFDGGRLRQASLAEDPEAARALLESYLESAVYAEGQR